MTSSLSRVGSYIPTQGDKVVIDYANQVSSSAESRLGWSLANSESTLVLHLSLQDFS